jgi:outer membrane protein TolC
MRAGITPLLVLLLFMGAAGCAAAPEPLVAGPGPAADRQANAGEACAVSRSAEPPQTAALPETAGFDDCVAYAAQHNPELDAAWYRWRAALERVPQARALPDPRASFALVLDEVDRSARRMGERYAITQTVPWFGTRSLREALALEEAQAAARQYDAIRLQVIDQVAQAYCEYSYLRQAVAVTQEIRRLLARLESVVRALYRAGTAGQMDVVRAQVELGRLDDQVRSLEDLLGPAAADLNRALGRPAHAPLPASIARPSEPAGAELADHTDEQWLLLARRHNPELAAIRHEAAGLRRGVDLARRDARYPELMLGVEYARDAGARMAKMDGGGEDMLMPMITVNLPLWRAKYAAGTHEAQARYHEVSRRLQSRELAIEADLKRALFAYRDSGRKLDLYGATLLPRARQALAAAEASYRAGDAAFTDMIDAQRMLLEFALARERAAADRAQAVTRIHALTGHAGAVVPGPGGARQDGAVPPARTDRQPRAGHQP